ncbi:(d)CMP kinase [Actinotignum urinale]|uniref:(d)CMP kinase n=1 Tax=Actinotignum urinale TaxID=190146 RepID=UPI002A804294|nr:(d)CMP kinase [Actinotignum urinale]MDY5152134.1 (d)CMP kinase [Actinotignum urinale]
MSLIIAIDGPSGSGKSTVSKEVARRLGGEYLDTGAMYRAAAWCALRRDINLDDKDAVTEVVKNMDLRMPLDPDNQRFFCEGKDVTDAIRVSSLSRIVSKVAVNLDVRKELIARQQAIVYSADKIVAEGRDITSVVAPDADVKVLLTASEETRLARRAREVRGGDSQAQMEETRAEVSERDAKDSTVASFMDSREGVTTIDSSHMTICEVVDTILGLIPTKH